MQSLIKKILLTFPFISILVSCSGFTPLQTITLDVRPSESYAKQFYDSSKEEFLVFDNNSSFLQYFESENYLIGNDFYAQQKNILTNQFYEEFYLTMLNVVVGTSDEITVEQKNNQIIYHKSCPEIATDGLILKTIFNKVQKMDFKIEDFNFEIKLP